MNSKLLRCFLILMMISSKEMASRRAVACSISARRGADQWNLYPVDLRPTISAVTFHRSDNFCV
jgi:hypothetical protein